MSFTYSKVQICLNLCHGPILLTPECGRKCHDDTFQRLYYNTISYLQIKLDEGNNHNDWHWEWSLTFQSCELKILSWEAFSQGTLLIVHIARFSQWEGYCQKFFKGHWRWASLGMACTAQHRKQYFLMGVITLYSCMCTLAIWIMFQCCMLQRPPKSTACWFEQECKYRTTCVEVNGLPLLYELGIL